MSVEPPKYSFFRLVVQADAKLMRPDSHTPPNAELHFLSVGGEILHKKTSFFQEDAM